jgi:glycosyltransferase involved in cell wall biosynthesis
MLEAALPQVKECGDLVELWVSDNASSDNTPEVVESSRTLGPIHYSRNASNLGSHGNFVKLATKLARGEYVWLVGDDDLLLPDALSRVISALRTNWHMDAFYANFRHASYENDWPGTAIGGYRGGFISMDRPDTEHRALLTWKELIRVESGLCGNMYANIVRRRVWVEYWKNRKVPPQSCAKLLAWYPHTTMFADTLMARPAYYIGEPVLTTFHGSQEFLSANPIDRVVALYMPQVLRHYRKRGLSGSHWTACEQATYAWVRSALVGLLRESSASSLSSVCAYLRAGWWHSKTWLTLMQAIRLTGKPRLANMVLSAIGTLNRSLGIIGAWSRAVL